MHDETFMSEPVEILLIPLKVRGNFILLSIFPAAAAAAAVLLIDVASSYAVVRAAFYRFL